MRYLAVLAILLALAACGSGSAGTDPSPLGHTYLSDAVTDQGKPRQLVAGTQISLNFTSDHRLIAQAGCNTINAPVDLSGGKVALGETETTLMGCGAGRSEQDAWLADVLKAAHWRGGGTTLHVASRGPPIVVSGSKEVPPGGAEWRV